MTMPEWKHKHPFKLTIYHDETQLKLFIVFYYSKLATNKQLINVEKATSVLNWL
jgi:rRNA maturation protein Rpf1